VAEVEIYSSMFCPFCHRAKRLLSEKGVDFIEIDVDMDGARRREMMERANGRHTVPQIFIDGTHVGGSDDLAALDGDGKLDPMLGLG
jgi:glutaredoxin 3